MIETRPYCAALMTMAALAPVQEQWLLKTIVIFAFPPGAGKLLRFRHYRLDNTDHGRRNNDDEGCLTIVI